MKKLALALPLFLMGCADSFSLNPTVTREVNVLGRTWSVSQDAKNPNAWSAIRDLNNHNPFGKPVALMTPQAIRAIELASNCAVLRPTVRSDTNARFYADVACRQ